MGKCSTSTQTVSIPPCVLAKYNAAFCRACQAAKTPFQFYSTNPASFVAPLSSTQSAGICNINNASGLAQGYYGAATQQLQCAQAQYQPYQGAATSLALAGGQGVCATPITGRCINRYMNPYLGSVVGSEAALLNQNNQQAMAGQLGNAIKSGAYGGCRAGIAAANLAQQQQLANANIYSGLLSQGYTQALCTARQQQGVNLGAQQANRAALQNAASQLSGLGAQGYGIGTQTAQSLAGFGTGAQAAAIQGAQAQLGAGAVCQQTQQAALQALYNQFLQQVSYPYQQAQYLTNAALGIGQASGQTTTSTTPGGLFSDERLKDDIKEVGKTFDGQPIYSYKYKGDNTTQIGLLAQDVEKKHPHAVGVVPSGYKTVNYEEATRGAADRGHFLRGGFADGGNPAPSTGASTTTQSTGVAPATTGATAAAPACYTSAIQSDYQKVLGRCADPAGLAYWNSVAQKQIACGGNACAVLGNIYSAFQTSPEAKARAATNASAAPATTAGATANISRANDKPANTGVAPAGTAATKATGATPTDYTSAITKDYMNALGRAPDAAGLAYWNNVAQTQIAAGNNPCTVLANIAAAFGSSSELAAKNAAKCAPFNNACGFYRGCNAVAPVCSPQYAPVALQKLATYRPLGVPCTQDTKYAMWRGFGQRSVPTPGGVVPACQPAAASSGPAPAAGGLAPSGCTTNVMGPVGSSATTLAPASKTATTSTPASKTTPKDNTITSALLPAAAPNPANYPDTPVQDTELAPTTPAKKPIVGVGDVTTLDGSTPPVDNGSAVADANVNSSVSNLYSTQPAGKTPIVGVGDVTTLGCLLYTSPSPRD